MSLVLIPQPAVREVWALAAPYLDRAEKAGALQSVAEWREECAAGAKQLWFVWSDDDFCEGAGVTYLTEAPDGKTCIIDGFAAKDGHKAWKASMPTLEAWAFTQGCKRVRIYGRVGWMKALKDYAVKGVILDKEL
jgi:hypothetical protein